MAGQHFDVLGMRVDVRTAPAGWPARPRRRRCANRSNWSAWRGAAAGRTGWFRGGCRGRWRSAYRRQALVLVWCAGKRCSQRDDAAHADRASAWPVRGRRCRPGSSRSGWPCARLLSTASSTCSLADRSTPARGPKLKPWFQPEACVAQTLQVAAQREGGRIAGRQAGEHDDRVAVAGRCALQREPGRNHGAKLPGRTQFHGHQPGAGWGVGRFVVGVCIDGVVDRVPAVPVGQARVLQWLVFARAKVPRARAGLRAFDVQMDY